MPLTKQRHPITPAQYWAITDHRQGLLLNLDTYHSWRQLCSSRYGDIRGRALAGCQRTRAMVAYRIRELHTALHAAGLTRTQPRT